MGATVTLDGIQVSARWFRDHGDDPASVNPDTMQREVDTFAIPRDMLASSLEDDGLTLTIGWSDGATTTHDRAALLALVGAPREPGPRAESLTLDPGAELWATQPEIETFAASVVDDDDAWTGALAHLRRVGWVRFEGATLSDAPVRRLAGRIGGPRTTLFGDVWRIASRDVDHQDSAYAPVPLDVHTGGPYLNECPGTIIFAQQEKDGAGGNSVLVDGFAVARDLAASEPGAAELLSRYLTRGRFSGAGRRGPRRSPASADRCGWSAPSDQLQQPRPCPGDAGRPLGRPGDRRVRGVPGAGGRARTCARDHVVAPASCC